MVKAHPPLMPETLVREYFKNYFSHAETEDLQKDPHGVIRYGVQFLLEQGQQAEVINANTRMKVRQFTTRELQNIGRMVLDELIAGGELTD